LQGEQLISIQLVTYPDRFRDVNHLEEVMTSPSAALVADMPRITGDIIILGVGGKMGPTLARLAKRAARLRPGAARHNRPQKK
jgi:hypothetical protein